MSVADKRIDRTKEKNEMTRNEKKRQNTNKYKKRQDNKKTTKIERSLHPFYVRSNFTPTSKSRDVKQSHLISKQKFRELAQKVTLLLWRQLHV